MAPGKSLAKRMRANPIRVTIITVSDRSSRGERPDTSGPALIRAVSALGWQVVAAQVIPDQLTVIMDVIRDWSDNNGADLILTTGGTGLSPQDVTPEATLAIIDQLVPGLAEAMRAESIKVNPHAMLSRSITGIRKSTLIINLPGNPIAAVENFSVVQGVIPHAIQLITQDLDSESGHFLDPK
jgi:molybdopterin adenylyltransferase